MTGYIDYHEPNKDETTKETNIFVTRTDITVAKPKLAKKNSDKIYKHFPGRHI